MRRLLDAFWAFVFASKIDRERKRCVEAWPNGRPRAIPLDSGTPVHVAIDATVVGRTEFNDGWLYYVEGSDDGRRRWVPDYNVEAL